MAIHNLINCAGFGEASGFLNFGACMKARLGIVILFFIVAMIRKWGGEEAGISFNFYIGIIAGLLLYLITITIFGSYKIAFIIGLLASLVVGYGVGYFIEGED